MELTHIVLIISLVANLLLGWLIYFSSNRKLVYKLYAGLGTSTALWIALNLLTEWFQSILAFRATYSIGAILPILGFFWYKSFKKEKLLQHTSQRVAIILGSFFSILPFMGGAIVLNASRFFLGGIVGTLGPMYIFWAIYMIGFLFYILFLITKDYHYSKGLEKIQIRYILFGFYGFALIPLTVSVVLPFFKVLNLTWLDSFGSVPLVVSLGYAIARYRLMSIRFILTRSILYTILVATVASFFAFFIFWLAPQFGGDTRNGKIISTILSSILIVVFLDPIKRVFAKLTDAIFYKDKINYSQILQKASSIVAKEIDLQKLLHELAILLSRELKLKKVKVFMPINGKFTLTASSQSQNQTLFLTEHITKYFGQQKDIVITEELFRQKDETEDQERQKFLDKITQELETIGSEMTVPIVETGQINALFILSNKMSGDIFGTEDIDFFNLLSPQIATAIEKSKLYEEVQELNRDLQKKVDERTESLRKVNLDLEDRNKYLTTMQVVLNMVSRTLDLKQVTQMIANSIAAELGYIGGVLSFVNGDNKLRVKAVTQNKQAKESISLLPDDIFHYEADLKSGYNFGVDTVLTAKINFSENMTDFFSPPVEKHVINLIQEKLGVKTIVGVPIFSEDRIIGVVHFLLAIEREKISPLDIEVMTSLTSQVGIVSRNLALYENLQKVNYDLNEANLHLKALDKAKSEFLSIASHQLRTPVSALKGYLSMMMEGDFGPLPEKINKLIGDLFESASRLARTINVFLNVSRIEAGRMKLEKKPIQISDLIASVTTELASAATNKNIKLNYAVDQKTLPLVYADSDKLREVILNLIDNAIKYTPQGSITIKTLVQGNILEFSSQDTGVGIEPAEAQALFRKFVRGDGAAQINTGGSGLGLFIAQKIIKEHEGNIWVESAGKGKGSVFKFTVPLATPEQIKESSKPEVK